MHIPKYDVNRVLDYIFNTDDGYTNDTIAVYEVDKNDEITNLFKNCNYIISESGTVSDLSSINFKTMMAKPVKVYDFVGIHHYENIPDYFIFVAINSESYNAVFNLKDGKCLYNRLDNTKTYELRMCKYSIYDKENINKRKNKIK